LNPADVDHPNRSATVRRGAANKDVPSDFDIWQFYISVGTIIGVAITVRPLGFTGFGLVQLLLVIVNSALLLARSVPDTILGPRTRRLLIVPAVLASAAMMATASNSVGPAFAFFFAGHAGFRFPRRLAFAAAAATSLACTAALLIAAQTDHSAAPWYVGLLAGLPVVIGQSNQDRQRALSTARLALEQTQRAAEAEARERALAERARIARDVHDVLAHSLAGINMQLEVVDALLEQGRSDEARAATQRAQAVVRDGLVEVQRTVRALRDETLPLPETLHRLVAGALAPGTIYVLGEARPTEVEIGQIFVRTAQEGLTNAHKHAPGAPVRIELVYGQGILSMSVVNGPAAASGKDTTGSGLGLVGLRERVALVGGTATAGPITEGEDAGGWRVHIVVPT